MTDMLLLTYASDGEASSDSLSLLDFTSGLTLDEGGWIPQVFTDNQGSVVETLTFHVNGLSHDQIAASIQQIDIWKRRVVWSHDPTQRQFVWLNARLKTETNTRRAAVYNLNYSLDSSPFGVHMRDNNFVSTLSLVIERGEWEDISLKSAGTPGIGADGGIGISALSVDGDIPARIQYCSIEYPPDAPGLLRYSWLGFRSSRSGVLANFESVWSLSDAVFLSADCTVTVDATAYNGNKVVIDFGSGVTLTNHINIITSDVTANVDDQRGEFTCLLRAKMSDTSIARVRLSSGFAGASYSNPYNVNPRVPIQGTSWFLYDMGTIRLPALAQKFEVIASLMQQAGVILDAELVSGTGDLEVDCLFMIPRNDGMMKVDVGKNTTHHIIYTNPDYTNAAFNQTDYSQSVIESLGWSLPANSEKPIMVLAAQGATSHVLGLSAEIAMLVYERWRTLRGAE